MSLAIRGTSARQKCDEPSSSIGQPANRQVVVEALSRHVVLRASSAVAGSAQVPRASAANCWCALSHTGCGELARGGLRQSHLRRIAQQFKKLGGHGPRSPGAEARNWLVRNGRADL
jgi:hypothetical protein